MDAVHFAPLTKENWADFEALFEAPGAPKYCWCTAWRHLADRQTATNAQKKAAIRREVDGGIPTGVLAYEGSTPVGWCSMAPRRHLRKLSPRQDDREGDVWSVVCFFVPRPWRRKGLAGALLDAAIDHAFASGAEAVEAYPVDPESPSYRFMGFRDMFSKRGFDEIGMAGTRRHVVRLERST